MSGQGHQRDGQRKPAAPREETSSEEETTEGSTEYETDTDADTSHISESYPKDTTKHDVTSKGISLEIGSRSQPGLALGSNARFDGAQPASGFAFGSNAQLDGGASASFAFGSNAQMDGASQNSFTFGSNAKMDGTSQNSFTFGSNAQMDGETFQNTFAFGSSARLDGGISQNTSAFGLNAQRDVLTSKYETKGVESPNTYGLQSETNREHSYSDKNFIDKQVSQYISRGFEKGTDNDTFNGNGYGQGRNGKDSTYPAPSVLLPTGDVPPKDFVSSTCAVPPVSGALPVRSVPSASSAPPTPGLSAAGQASAVTSFETSLVDDAASIHGSHSRSTISEVSSFSSNIDDPPARPVPRNRQKSVSFGNEFNTVRVYTPDRQDSGSVSQSKLTKGLDTSQDSSFDKVVEKIDPISHQQQGQGLPTQRMSNTSPDHMDYHRNKVAKEDITIRNTLQSGHNNVDNHTPAGTKTYESKQFPADMEAKSITHTSGNRQVNDNVTQGSTSDNYHHKSKDEKETNPYSQTDKLNVDTYQRDMITYSNRQELNPRVIQENNPPYSDTKNYVSNTSKIENDVHSSRRESETKKRQEERGSQNIHFDIYKKERDTQNRSSGFDPGIYRKQEDVYNGGSMSGMYPVYRKEQIHSSSGGVSHSLPGVSTTMKTIKENDSGLYPESTTIGRTDDKAMENRGTLQGPDTKQVLSGEYRSKSVISSNSISSNSKADLGLHRGGPESLQTDDPHAKGMYREKVGTQQNTSQFSHTSRIPYKDDFEPHFPETDAAIDKQRSIAKLGVSKQHKTENTGSTSQLTTDNKDPHSSDLSTYIQRDESGESLDFYDRFIAPTGSSVQSKRHEAITDKENTTQTNKDERKESKGHEPKKYTTHDIGNTDTYNSKLMEINNHTRQSHNSNFDRQRDVKVREIPKTYETEQHGHLLSHPALPISKISEYNAAKEVDDFGRYITTNKRDINGYSNQKQETATVNSPTVDNQHYPIQTTGTSGGNYAVSQASYGVIQKQGIGPHNQQSEEKIQKQIPIETTSGFHHQSNGTPAKTSKSVINEYSLNENRELNKKEHNQFDLHLPADLRTYQTQSNPVYGTEREDSLYSPSHKESTEIRKTPTYGYSPEENINREVKPNDLPEIHQHVRADLKADPTQRNHLYGFEREDNRYSQSKPQGAEIGKTPMYGCSPEKDREVEQKELSKIDQHVRADLKAYPSQRNIPHGFTREDNQYIQSNEHGTEIRKTPAYDYNPQENREIKQKELPQIDPHIRADLKADTTNKKPSYSLEKDDSRYLQPNQQGSELTKVPVHGHGHEVNRDRVLKQKDPHQIEPYVRNNVGADQPQSNPAYGLEIGYSRDAQSFEQGNQIRTAYGHDTKEKKERKHELSKIDPHSRIDVREDQTQRNSAYSFEREENRYNHCNQQGTDIRKDQLHGYSPEHCREVRQQEPPQIDPHIKDDVITGQNLRNPALENGNDQEVQSNEQRGTEIRKTYNKWATGPFGPSGTIGLPPAHYLRSNTLSGDLEENPSHTANKKPLNPHKESRENEMRDYDEEWNKLHHNKDTKDSIHYPPQTEIDKYSVHQNNERQYTYNHNLRNADTKPYRSEDVYNSRNTDIPKATDVQSNTRYVTPPMKSHYTEKEDKTRMNTKDVVDHVSLQNLDRYYQPPYPHHENPYTTMEERNMSFSTSKKHSQTPVEHKEPFQHPKEVSKRDVEPLGQTQHQSQPIPASREYSKLKSSTQGHIRPVAASRYTSQRKHLVGHESGSMYDNNDSGGTDSITSSTSKLSGRTRVTKKSRQFSDHHPLELLSKQTQTNPRHILHKKPDKQMTYSGTRASAGDSSMTDQSSKADKDRGKQKKKDDKGAKTKPKAKGKNESSEESSDTDHSNDVNKTGNKGNKKLGVKEKKIDDKGAKTKPKMKDKNESSEESSDTDHSNDVEKAGNKNNKKVEEKEKKNDDKGGKTKSKVQSQQNQDSSESSETDSSSKGNKVGDKGKTRAHKDKTKATGKEKIGSEASNQSMDFEVTPSFLDAVLDDEHEIEEIQQKYEKKRENGGKKGKSGKINNIIIIEDPNMAGDVLKEQPRNENEEMKKRKKEKAKENIFRDDDIRPTIPIHIEVERALRDSEGPAMSAGKKSQNVPAVSSSITLSVDGDSEFDKSAVSEYVNEIIIRGIIESKKSKIGDEQIKVRGNIESVTSLGGNKGGNREGKRLSKDDIGADKGVKEIRIRGSIDNVTTTDGVRQTRVKGNIDSVQNVTAAGSSRDHERYDNVVRRPADEPPNQQYSGVRGCEPCDDAQQIAWAGLLSAVVVFMFGFYE